VAFAWTRCRFFSANVPYFFVDYTLPTWKAYLFHIGLALLLVVYFLLASLGLDRIADLDVEWRFGLHCAVVFCNMRLLPPWYYRQREQEREAKKKNA